MCDEAVVEIPVQSLEHVGGIATVGCSHAGKSADIRLALDPASGAEVILHVQTGISADLLLPFLAEGGRSTAVRHHHDVALLSHHTVAPAVAPALAVGSLRPS